jgi:hypothetical protein
MTISANSGSLCRVTLTRGFWFADLESGDGFGGRAAGLGQQLVGPGRQIPRADCADP